ncbi:MAG: CPBP family intramembrane glutamic endopeptidase [Cellvibrio sp.]|uniref:CPBP family intramembrane glutamic endopeptidase n=1 Tax=Cellvibrio sp. TaxID=1965322 RepID=UPI0031B4CBD2
MPANDNKLSFAYVLVSQFCIVFIGCLIVIAAELPWRWWHSSPVVDLSLGIFAAVVTYALMYFVYLYGGRVAEQLTIDVKKMGRHFIGYSWGKLVIISILAGVGEELLFRVGLQAWFATHVNIYLAILIPALIFGLLHFISFVYFVVATLMGIVFGVAYHFSDSLVLVMLWHGAYDLIALAVLVKYPHIIGVSFEEENATLIS